MMRSTVAEDAPATTVTVLANDTDVDGGPISIASVTPPTNGAVVITNGGADLTYQPNLDYCNTSPGATSDTFTYTLTPGGSTATVSVAVTCGNDAPVVDLDGPADDPGGDIDFAVTFTEGTPVVIVDAANLTVTDVDSPNLDSATVTITNLVDVGVETLTATTAGTGITANYVAPVLTLTGTDTLANYQQVLRTVTYNNTSQNPNTTARTITFVGNDGTIDSALATSTVTIQAINSAPSFTKGADQTVNEDAGAQTVTGWATAIEDGDGGGQTLTFNVTGNTNTALFSAQPAISTTGVLTYTPAADANGTATITMTLSDGGGTANGGIDTSAAQMFTITVNSVNDAPSFTKGPDQTVLEDSGPQMVNPWATAISAGPTDEAGQTLTFNITSNTNTGLFSAGPTISPTGVLTYTPVAGASGSATITLTLSDDGGTANGGVDTSAPPQTFTITVSMVDDPPVAVDDGATVAEEAAATTIPVLANDTDSDAGPISIGSVTQPTNGTVVNNGTNVSYTPAADYCNDPPGTTPDTFTYTLTPGSSMATVNVTVNCVNDAPVVNLDPDNSGTMAPNFAVTFTEGGAAVVLGDSDLSVTDGDSANLATATLTITNLLNAGQETLSVDTTGTSIMAVYTAPTLTLTGSETLANYQQVLRTVRYSNSSHQPRSDPS